MGDLFELLWWYLMEGYNELLIVIGFWFFGEVIYVLVDVKGDEVGCVDN